MALTIAAHSRTMSEALARIKKVPAGHRSPTTRLMQQLEGEYEIEAEPVLDRLMQYKASLNEKLDKLHKLDEQISTLVKDDDIENEIEQADQFRENSASHFLCREQD